jgi:hypothetical protein
MIMRAVMKGKLQSFDPDWHFYVKLPQCMAYIFDLQSSNPAFPYSSLCRFES